MYRVERANNLQGWVIYNGHGVPRTTYHTRAEARMAAVEANALDAEERAAHLSQDAPVERVAP